MQVTTAEPYALANGTGIAHVWFFGGARISVKVDGTRTSGRLYQVHLVELEGSGQPLHIHHNADETFYVVNGQLSIVVGDQRIEAGPVVAGEPAPEAAYPDPEEFARAVAAWSVEIVGPPLALAREQP
jgi:hypothetical protein